MFVLCHSIYLYIFCISIDSLDSVYEYTQLLHSSRLNAIYLCSVVPFHVLMIRSLKRLIQNRFIHKQTKHSTEGKENATTQAEEESITLLIP